MLGCFGGTIIFGITHLVRPKPKPFGGGNSKIFCFTPKIGEDEPMWPVWTTILFQRGLFNHQLENPTKNGCSRFDDVASERNDILSYLKIDSKANL